MADISPTVKNELWTFPCNFTFKAMTLAINGIENNIVSAIQRHVPGDYQAVLKTSKGGKYFSVSVHIHLTNKQQLDAVYKEVHAVEGVKMIL
ncbi:MAG: DUF493 family protein [Gammaproteobacteria bacterium]|nr:DUF493 family protein [Gammaproteobacteria bacterium]